VRKNVVIEGESAAHARVRFARSQTKADFHSHRHHHHPTSAGVDSHRDSSQKTFPFLLYQREKK
jgi:hypothetical protein